jgi:signal transduction histidine kinase
MQVSNMSSTKQQSSQPLPDPPPRITRNFVSTAAHDLREPLRAIRAHVQLLANASEDVDSNRRGQSVRYIHDGVDRLEGLIRDIEDYCLEELRELAPKEVNMELPLLEALRQQADQMEGCGAQLTHDPLPAITGDFDGLANVFRILIDNACKFRAEAPLRIQVAAIRQWDWVFSVRDNGQGFSPGYAEQIFRPFERLNGKQYPGSGLGLPLAKRIVERHGGRMWAESTPGRGSTFWFSLK